MVEDALETYGYDAGPERRRRSSPSTARPTTTASSTSTPPDDPRGAPARTSSPACRTPTAAAGSSATTAASRSTASTALIAAKQADRAALDLGRVDRGRDPRPRGARRADQGAGRAQGRWRASYGFDISGPAGHGAEAVQWLYFAYLAAVKEQNGAAMSLGRTSTFLDIYLQRDLAAGRLDRGAGAGAHRRLRDQAADRALPAHPGVRRAVLRRPDLGHRVDRRHGRRRPDRWSRRTASGSCRPSTTWARRRSRT